MRNKNKKYITYWKDTTITQNTLECFLAFHTVLGGKLSDHRVGEKQTIYRLKEHSLAIETGRHRRIWLPREDRLCTLCPQREVETELHFLFHCEDFADIQAIFFCKKRKQI